MAATLALLPAVAGAGCAVRVYQPLSGLHRPVAIDPRRPNFTDTRLDVRCARGDLLSVQEAGALCQKVSTLFANQGAEVTAPDDSPLADAGPRTELTLELRARQTDVSDHPFSWLLFAGSLTVLPGVIESSFAQEVILRDASGFLLVTDTLEGRVVTRYGFGVWFGNALLDLTRKKENKLGNGAASRDLSADLYRQLSQDVFNARMYAQVLEQAAPVERKE